MLPETLARAMSAGIGLFLAFIGYQASEGIGVVGGNGATLVSLGSFPFNTRKAISFFLQRLQNADSDFTAMECYPQKLLGCSPPAEQSPACIQLMLCLFFSLILLLLLLHAFPAKGKVRLKTSCM